MAEKEAPVGRRVAALIEETLDGYLADPGAAEAAVQDNGAGLPPEVTDRAGDLIALNVPKKSPAYRDAIIIQLGYGLVAEEAIDLTRRQVGGRSVAKALGDKLKASHIQAVADAYQNIGKNTDNLCRGNVPFFDDLLVWATGASRDARLALFHLVTAAVALTARPVLPMPSLDRTRLSFFAVASLMNTFLATPSGGAHQQFAVAAFLGALIEEFGMDGPNALRVETKRINASDLSSKTAGDVQILRGGRVEEAFEVTANDWEEKLGVARHGLKQADLQRSHIVAAVGDDVLARAAALMDPAVDITVIDCEALIRTIAALMRRPAREAALRRIHEYLERYQPDIERVNAYVRLLRDRGLAEA